MPFIVQQRVSLGVQRNSNIVKVNSISEMFFVFTAANPQGLQESQQHTVPFFFSLWSVTFICLCDGSKVDWP
jgi:hypothetical protein